MQITWKVWRMVLAVFFASCYLCLGGLIFWLIEGDTFSTSPFNSSIEGKRWGSYLNAIYFCAVTLTTIGYGDLVPTSTTARLILFIYASIGLGIMGFTMVSISDVVVNKVQHLCNDTRICPCKKKGNERKCCLFKCCSPWTRMSYTARKLVIGLFFFFFVVFAGALVFMFVEGWKYTECLYFCFVTLTTIGYGDYTPQTAAGRAIVIPFAFIGLGITSFLFTRVAYVLAAKTKELTESVNNSQHSVLITFDFQDTINEEMNQILKKFERSVIPSIHTDADAEKLTSIIKGMLDKVEKKRQSVSEIDETTNLIPNPENI